MEKFHSDRKPKYLQKLSSYVNKIVSRIFSKAFCYDGASCCFQTGDIRHFTYDHRNMYVVSYVQVVADASLT